MHMNLLVLLLVSYIVSIDAGDGHLRGIGNSTKVQEETKNERHLDSISLRTAYDDRVEFKPTSKPWTGKLHKL